METILYMQLKEAETFNDIIERDAEKFLASLSKFEGLPGYSKISLGKLPQIDIAKVQKNLMKKYENNPVFYDAIQGTKTVEESLNELARVNKGIRKILPRRKDTAHNDRISQLGELITEPNYLRSNGIWMPDNIVSTAIEVTGLVFLASNLFTRLIIPETDVNIDPEELARDLEIYQVFMPAMISEIMAPLMGFITNARRFSELPTEEVKYIDLKIEEFY